MYLIEVDFRHDAMIILVLFFDKPSFKNLSLTHGRPSNLSLLLRSDEQGFLRWLVLLLGVPLAFCHLHISDFLISVLSSSGQMQTGLHPTNGNLNLKQEINDKSKAK